MSKVITFSRFFPGYHPKAGEPTGFVEKVWQSLFNTDEELVSDFYLSHPGLKDASDRFSGPFDFSPKHHTIRQRVDRFEVGDWFAPRVWSGKPYNSKQIQFAPDIEVRKVWDFKLDEEGCIYIDGNLYAYPNSDFALQPLAQNDGLDWVDLLNWFNKPLEGQIICWNENINY